MYICLTEQFLFAERCTPARRCILQLWIGLYPLRRRLLRPGVWPSILTEGGWDLRRIICPEESNGIITRAENVVERHTNGELYVRRPREGAAKVGGLTAAKDRLYRLMWTVEQQVEAISCLTQLRRCLIRLIQNATSVPSTKSLLRHHTTVDPTALRSTTPAL